MASDLPSRDWLQLACFNRSLGAHCQLNIWSQGWNSCSHLVNVASGIKQRSHIQDNRNVATYLGTSALFYYILILIKYAFLGVRGMFIWPWCVTSSGFLLCISLTSVSHSCRYAFRTVWSRSIHRQIIDSLHSKHVFNPCRNNAWCARECICVPFQIREIYEASMMLRSRLQSTFESTDFWFLPIRIVLTSSIQVDDRGLHWQCGWRSLRCPTLHALLPFRLLCGRT